MSILFVFRYALCVIMYPIYFKFPALILSLYLRAKVDRLSQRLGPYTLFDFCKYRSQIAKLFLTQNTVLRPDIWLLITKKSFLIDYMKLAELYKIFHMPRLLHMK